MLFASLVMSEWKRAGSSIIIFFVYNACLLLPPSIEYAASVHGAPTKPMSVLLPSTSLFRAWRDRFVRMCCDVGVIK